MERTADEKATRRALLVGRIVFVWAVLIAGRLGYLQIVKHEEYVKLAKLQHKHMVQIPALRGELLGRDGKPLGISIRTESAAVNPMRIVDPEFFASVVAPVLGLDKKELAQELLRLKKRGPKKVRGRGFAMLKRHLTAEERDRLTALKRTFPIELVEDARREYPNGTVGAHVVGSIDAEGNGNAGVEQKLNGELKGKPGKMLVLVGSRQDSYVTWVSEESVQGLNVTLSVDPVIQYDAERYLAEAVEETRAEGGTVVAMDPQTGAVLALANYPLFDPRRETPTAAEAKARHTNTAVQIPCEPGSVMKMITVTMGIDTGLFTPETIINCENGAFARPKRKAIHDHHRYGGLDVAGVLIKSSNIGVAKISLAAGPKAMYEYLKKFGIGDRTGIELPAESRGLLRPQECVGKNPCWDPASHEYIAFGHEVAATAVQLARAVAVIANGGLLVEPHIVLKKTRPQADGREEVVPVAAREMKRVLKAETCFTVRRIMERVVMEGTGKAAAVPGYSSGGKTGSAEIRENGGWQNLHNSSFIGFAPVTNPRVVVVVTLNRTPRLGGVAAAPVFKKVAETALRVLQVPKDKPETDVVVRPAAEENAEKPEMREEAAPAGEKPEVRETEQMVGPEPASPVLVGPRVPDFRGKTLLAVLRESSERGVDVETRGQGKAREQSPAPGAILPRGGRVMVKFSVAR
jgi:cell division protein FtsI (penicillin-binding protein 3)